MHLEHSLVIPARPEVVWAVTIDIERWPEWTPTMERIERLDTGPFRVGSQARIKQPQFKEAVWTVTTLEPGRGFTWATRTGGLTMVASHEVVPSPGGCTSILQLDVTGLVALLLAPLVRRGAAQAMATENICLEPVSKLC
ncbi:MAG TPA: SRPBCC family protein [Pirellulales bacterium]|jgi:hypothetical protein